jgi:hypothetical protein
VLGAGEGDHRLVCHYLDEMSIPGRHSRSTTPWPKCPSAKSRPEAQKRCKREHPGHLLASVAAGYWWVLQPWPERELAFVATWTYALSKAERASVA